MRKITSKHADEKKAKRNKMILGLFLVFIMFFSIAEYAFLSSPESETVEQNSITYNGLKFTSQNGYWILNKDSTNFIFKYNPNQIQDMNFEAKELRSYQDKILYLKMTNVQAESELRANLGSLVNGIVSVEEENCQENTIVIESKDQNRIYQNENCVYIQGNENELVKLTDEFLFNLLDIRS